jgi:hypothetical protein
MKRKVVMTHRVLQVSAIALGVAALVSLSPLSAARADISTTGGAASAPSGAALPSGGPGTPTENAAASTGGEVPAVQPPARPYVGHYAHHYAPRTHYAWRKGHRYVYYGYRHNPVATAATGVVGGVADLGSIAAYPIYCFPNYGSCPVYLPY